MSAKRGDGTGRGHGAFGEPVVVPHVRSAWAAGWVNRPWYPTAGRRRRIEQPDGRRGAVSHAGRSAFS